MRGDRVVVVAGHVALFVLGVALAVVGTLLIPLRWPGGFEGLSVVVAVVGNVLLCWLGAVGMGSALAGALGGIGWLVTVLTLGSNLRPGDVLIASAVPGDPGLGTVGILYLFLGGLGAVIGVVLGANRVARQRPSRPGGLHPRG